MPFDGSELGRIIEEMIIAAIPMPAIEAYSQFLIRGVERAPVPLALVFLHKKFRLVNELELRKRNQQAA